MEKELVSELAAQPEEGKKKTPLSKEKKRHKQQKEKKKPNKKIQQTTTTTTRETKYERQPKTQVSLHKVKLLRTNNKTYTSFFTKQCQIIL
jgi:hypothetical protein